VSEVPEVGAVMTAFPHCIAPGAPVHQAQALMERHAIRHLPVIDGSRIVGIVTDRDVERTLDPLLGMPPQLAVHRIMVPDPYVVEPTEPLESVLSTLAQRRIGCAIVAQDGKLVGIFTATDACRLYGEALRARHPPSP